MANLSLLETNPDTDAPSDELGRQTAWYRTRYSGTRSYYEVTDTETVADKRFACTDVDINMKVTDHKIDENTVILYKPRQIVDYAKDGGTFFLFTNDGQGGIISRYFFEGHEKPFPTNNGFQTHDTEAEQTV